MRIAEIFYSVQGEGSLVGVPSVFVRTSGCNLRCTWCDTPYASWAPEGRDLSPPQILEQITPHKCRYIVLTGGEPMMFRELVPLIEALKQQNHHITVETAGTLWLDHLPSGSIDLASISPKLSNSTPLERDGGRFAQMHERQRINWDILNTFATGGHGAILDRQWKFVISTREDLTEMQDLLDQLNAALEPAHKIQPHHILLMPEGIDVPTLTDRARWLAEICKQKGYRLSPRLHVYLYGNTKGT